jgi:hypothetical protein
MHKTYSSRLEHVEIDALAEALGKLDRRASLIGIDELMMMSLKALV